MIFNMLLYEYSHFVRIPTLNKDVNYCMCLFTGRVPRQQLQHSLSPQRGQQTLKITRRDSPVSIAQVTTVEVVSG